MIQKWLPSSLKSKSLKLAYSGSRDGDTKEAFLSKCGGKGPLLYVVKATDGHRLGGYRSVKVDSSKDDREDKTAFLFSLTEGEVARLTGKDDECVHDGSFIVRFVGFVGFVGLYGVPYFSESIRIDPESVQKSSGMEFV